MKEIKELPTQGKFVVLFISDHCPHCKSLMKTLKQLEKKYSDKGIDFFTVNISKNQEIATKYGIMSVPFTVFMNGKKVVGKEVGAVSSKTIEINLNDLIKDGEFINKIKKLLKINK